LEKRRSVRGGENEWVGKKKGKKKKEKNKSRGARLREVLLKRLFDG